MHTSPSPSPLFKASTLAITVKYPALSDNGISSDSGKDQNPVMNGDTATSAL
jgi:hypothetical protein